MTPWQAARQIEAAIETLEDLARACPDQDNAEVFLEIAKLLRPAPALLDPDAPPALELVNGE